jgi:hypothetical protein
MKALWSPSLVLLFLLIGATGLVAQRIQVESAYYGPLNGAGVDVIRWVQRFADYGEPFRVSNDTLGVDPSPDRPKTLLVVYYVNGQRICDAVTEDEVFYFRTGGYTDYGPDFHKPGIRIIRATYGSGGRYVDVTGMVRDLVRNGESFTVANDTFGVDPYQGREKRLRISYIRGGKRREKEYAEGDSARFR